MHPKANFLYSKHKDSQEDHEVREESIGGAASHTTTDEDEGGILSAGGGLHGTRQALAAAPPVTSPQCDTTHSLLKVTTSS